MFGGAFTDFKPDEASMNGTVTAMRQVLNVVSKAQEEGLLAGLLDTEAVVHVFWASLHGVIHLYMGGHIGDAQSAHAVYRQSLTLMVGALLPQQPA
ncbi:TetR-like C-terminal domain-containing protein [Paenibacillus sp. y28]|uniref:TetR-like C-terminal domain-containing protein n=1 Tax=Paenibacillus sp. y28 TaxID=3129110 RepID=UPI00301A3BBB